MGGGKTASSTVSWLLCCPCRCVFCGVMSCLLSVLACILFGAGLVALILYLLLKPHIIHATVAAADLSEFKLTPRTWILRYNLTLEFQFCNPNKRIALHYHDITAQARYEGQRFAQANPPDFFQDTGEQKPLNLTFAGDSPLVGGVAAAGFRREAAEGAVFSVDVKVSSHMKLKVWAFKLPGPKTKIDCPLKLQRRGRGSAASHQFQQTECAVTFF